MSEAQGRDTCVQVPQRYSSSPSRPPCTLKSGDRGKKTTCTSLHWFCGKKSCYSLVKVKEHSDTINCYSKLEDKANSCPATTSVQ